MMRPTAIERAFELARSGRIHTLRDLRQQVKNEGYDAMALDGRALGAQLSAIIREARKASEIIGHGKLNAGKDK